MRGSKTAASAPARKVLLAAQPGGLNQRLLDYAGNLCRRIGAGLDVLWLEKEIPALLQTFVRGLQQERVACQVLPRPGCLRSEVLRQVAQDGRITVVVVDVLEDGQAGQWWTQLPCPVVAVNSVASG